MPSQMRLRRGLTVLVGALSLLAACAQEPAAQESSARAAPAATAAPSTSAVGGAVGKPPAGFEALEAVTPSGRTRFFVEIADTDAEREQGLMFRKEVPPDRGMLFDFNPPRAVAFWMRNTLIPLDLIYIRADGRVLSIARNAQPHDESGLPSGGVIVFVIELCWVRV